MSPPTRNTQPHDRLTSLADQMFDVLEDTDTRAIVMLSDSDSTSNAVCLHGWQEDADAVAHMMLHLQALLEANGHRLEFIQVPDSPADIEQENR